MWSWLNPKRLRDYPRLILVASWAVLILNIVFHRGWVGGLTGVLIGGDFISNYSGGVLYRTDTQDMYNPATQQQVQTALIAPSRSPGFAPFISPPWVGLTMSWIAGLPLPYALAAWELLNLVSVIFSVYLIWKYLLPATVSTTDMPAYQLLIVIVSSFAFVDGFLVGQSHGVILLLCTGILLAMMKDKWLLAGILASLLTYKPQFVLGFLVCWLIWRRWSALLSFVIFTGAWQIPVIVAHGFSPYLDYLQFSRSLMYLPYAKEGFPVSVMATPYALIATLLPVDFAKAVQILFAFLIIVLTGLLVYIAYKSRRLPANQRFLTYTMAVLFPLIIAPHALIYDLLFLVPGMVILLHLSEMTHQLKLLTVVFYVALLFFPLLGYALKLALPGLIPLALFALVVNYYFRSKTTPTAS